MRRNLLLPLLAIVLASIGCVAATFVTDTKPLLGLDLQGGVAVVLEPKGEVSSGTLNQSIEIIRNRIDALGVAEPEISRQGSSIIVQLPGVKDQERALRVVGQTAELRFRPVLSLVPPDEDTEVTVPTTASTAPTTTAAPDPANPTPQSTTTTAPINPKTTPREDDEADATVVLPQLDDDGDVVARYQLGPTVLTGNVIRTAEAQFNVQNSTWFVRFETTDRGSEQFDAMAAANLQKQVAIVLDGVVKSAPTIQEANFGGEGTITGDFTEREAKDLALVLRFGALPVELTPQQTQRVSATLGTDSLEAGIIAGLVGLALVVLYMIAYYRALGIVVVLGLILTGMLMWGIVTYLGTSSGLTLSLAGATGIIISVGVTVDSYVVYFERLKDEVRAGKTVRSSVDRGFKRAFSTIWAANMVSFIGAALLWILTVGPVRGFAFFLGLSTILDVLIAWAFTRPMVILLGRNRLFTEARWLGVARGLAVKEVS